MKRKLIKRVFFAMKIVLAIVLLAWVLSKANWGNYVQAKDGSTWTWLAPAPGEKPLVAEGYGTTFLSGRTKRTVREFRPDEFVPVNPNASEGDWSRRYVRPGFAESLRNMNLWLFALAVLAFPASMLVVAYRFWFLLRVQQIRIRLWEAVRLTFLGQFFNMVVPGTVGGDLVKAWYVGKHTHRTAGVIMTIFIDRLIGMIELVLMGGGMLLIVLAMGLETAEQMRRPIVTILIVAGIAAGAMAFFLSSRLRNSLGLQRIYQRLPIAHHLQAAGRSIRIFRRRPGYLLWSLAVTFLAHALYLGGITLIGFALRIDIPFYTYFVYLPLIYILGAVPITPGGVGWVENLYVEFFRSTAVATSTVIALAMLARIVPVFWGLPGLIVAVTGPKLPKVEDMQAELEQAEMQEQGEGA